MSFIDVVDHVISLAQKATIEDEKLKQRHSVDIGISMGDPKSQAYLAAARGLANELETYLSSLSSDDIGKLETLMYFGRDYKDIESFDIVQLHSKLHPNGINKAQCIRNITEKRPAIEIYFNEAKRMAKTLKMDLNNLL
ncbi:MAG: hypothetical protein ABIR09_02360 [Gallionella sp.]|jgi:hypothetical protein